MKVCNKCKQQKSIEDFALNRAKPDGRQGMCRPCKKESDARHYQNHKGKQLARNSANRKKYKAIINALKNVPCADCGNTYLSYVMDFDHVRGVKLGNIGDMHSRVSMETMLAEVAKCEVVCANCHRMRTHNRASEALK